MFTGGIDENYSHMFSWENPYEANREFREASNRQSQLNTIHLSLLALKLQCLLITCMEN